MIGGANKYCKKKNIRLNGPRANSYICGIFSTHFAVCTQKLQNYEYGLHLYTSTIFKHYTLNKSSSASLATTSKQ